jgi:hypothetical protein
MDVVGNPNKIFLYSHHVTISIVTHFPIENGTLITHSYTLQTRTRYLFCLCYSSCLKGVESDSAHFHIENG